MDKSKYVKTIYLSADDLKALAAKKLLDKAGRKQAILISIMAQEFMESFGIDENIDEDKLKNIITMYDVLKSMKRPEYHPPMYESSMNKPEHEVLKKEKSPKKEEKAEKSRKENNNENSIGEKDIEELENALSDFMIV